MQIAILETLKILDHPHQESYYQFIETFHDYLHAKNQLHHSFYSYNIAEK